MILPCIDLMDGKAVQLIQGKKKALEEPDIDSLMHRFIPFGEIQLIDLDAAMGRGSNLSLIKEISARMRCRVGGGIRTKEKAQEVIAAGAKKVIIGTAAFTDDGIDKEFLKGLNESLGKDKIIIAVDSKGEKIVVKGWMGQTSLDVFEAVKKLEPYCSGFLATYVDREGMMQGTDISFFKKLRSLTKNEITAAGGITTIDEARQLKDIGVNAAIGMAVYTGRISLDSLLKIN